MYATTRAGICRFREQTCCSSSKTCRGVLDAVRADDVPTYQGLLGRNDSFAYVSRYYRKGFIATSLAFVYKAFRCISIVGPYVGYAYGPLVSVTAFKDMIGVFTAANLAALTMTPPTERDTQKTKWLYGELARRSLYDVISSHSLRHRLSCPSTVNPFASVDFDLLSDVERGTVLFWDLRVETSVGCKRAVRDVLESAHAIVCNAFNQRYLVAYVEQDLNQVVPFCLVC
jgi:hypothetical protein